jgi:hypothetical protein
MLACKAAATRITLARPVPNVFAYLMLLAWPIVMVVLFQRLPPHRALIWSILGGYLVLPPVAVIDLPMVPGLDKVTIPALTAWLIVTLRLGHRVRLLPESAAARVLVVLFVAAPFATAMANSDAIYAGGGRVLPGMTLYDAFSTVVRQGFILLTFAMARSYLATHEAMRDLVRALVIAGLAYSVPMLLEVRLSPQLNIWIYGFFQHSFEQMMRGGGFRPIVFLEHGLWVAFLAFMAVMASVAMLREAPPDARARRIATTIYLALAYPLLRYADLVPVDRAVALAARLSEERAASLQFRFDNEAALLERAFQRPWFGWGPYERNLLHDPVTGQASAISDGRWVIVLGISGFLGYLAEFGMLALPVLLVWLRTPPGGHPVMVLALMLMLAVNMVDLMPNATVTPLTWLLAGALLGHAERFSLLPARPLAAPAPAAPRRTIL